MKREAMKIRNERYIKALLAKLKFDCAERARITWDDKANVVAGAAGIVSSVFYFLNRDGHWDNIGKTHLFIISVVVLLNGLRQSDRTDMKRSFLELSSLEEQVLETNK